MSRRCLGILLLLLCLPTALGHGGDAHTDSPSHVDAAEDEPAIPDGYTGPGREPYLSYFEGTWLYGQMSVTPLQGQFPRGMRGEGDWLVWEDAARSDIYVYNVAAGQGYYLMADRFVQRNPEISGGVIVWEDYRSFNRADVYAYFLDTGETRRITSGPGNHRNPSIDGALVAWEDDRNGTMDIWAASLLNHTEWSVSTLDDRESDPLVLDGKVYWRTYRFNVWDVVGYDAETGERFQVTSDANIQGAPFTNGRDVYFLTQFHSAWDLDRYDTREERVLRTNVRMQDTRPTPASGDHLLRTQRDVGYTQLVAQNLTSGTSTHVSGGLLLASDPVLLGRTAYAPVRTANGTSLLALEVSPFAWGKRPELTLTSPTGATPWLRPIAVQGVLTAGPGWTEPVTFTYRLDDGPPQVIAPGQRWRFTLDNAGAEPGNHLVTIRATFREGPPLETSFTLIAPEPTRSVDVEQAGPAYHAARVMSELNFYIVQNPAAYLLIPLVLIIVALVLVRVWLAMRPRRRPVAIEYVPPDDA